MQSVDWHKYINLLCRIFLVNFSRNFAKLHTGNGHGRFALVNLANTNLLHNYHGEGAWSLCVCTVYVPYCASGMCSYLRMLKKLSTLNFDFSKI